jgi:hypothetical protein
MPIIPPSLPWIRAAADRMFDPLLDLAAASYVPPKPQPEPFDWIGVVTNCDEGTIEQLTDPNTQSALAHQRDKITSATDGHRNMTIVRKEVGLRLKVGWPSSMILDIISADQEAGYALLLRGL